MEVSRERHVQGPVAQQLCEFGSGGMAECQADPGVGGAVLGQDAGEEGAVVVAKVLDSKEPNFGYNAATHSFTLDPTDAAYNNLAAGATRTVSVGYDVSDGALSASAARRQRRAGAGGRR